MYNFNDILQNEYSLKGKKDYSEPKIYDVVGDLNKHWYVYYSYRDLKTNKLNRQPPIYKGANRFNTKAERYEILMAYKQALKKLLSKGHSPYENFKVTDAKIKKEQKEAYWSVRAKITINGHYKRFVTWLKEKDLDKIDIKELKRREIATFLNS